MWRWRDGASVLVLRARVLHQNAPMNENERKRTDERTDERVRPALVVGRRHQSTMMRRAVVETARAMARATSRTVTMSSSETSSSSSSSSSSRARSMVTAAATRADGETGTREGGAGETVGKETTTRRRPRAMEVTPSASPEDQRTVASAEE